MYELELHLWELVQWCLLVIFNSDYDFQDVLVSTRLLKKFNSYLKPHTFEHRECSYLQELLTEVAGYCRRSLS